VLANPTAAGGKAVAALPEVTAAFDRLGAPYRVVETRSIEHAGEEAVAAAAAGETVAALGGDGFIRPLAGVLRDTDGALALLPGGRGNDLARVLGIPREPAAAAEVAVTGAERMLDVAEANGTPFMGIASLGFDSDANRIANEARLVRGSMVYLYAALRALVSWKPATFTLTVDGERHVVTGFSAAIGNSKAYGGGMYLFPHAELDDGRLEVLATSGTSKWRCLRGMSKVFKGTHLDLPEAHLWSGAEVTVDSDRPFDVYADGDPVARTPVTVTVRPRCLRMVVPA
jgi:YegS/Rv2252/BmrU family lipid kinase